MSVPLPVLYAGVRGLIYVGLLLLVGSQTTGLLTRYSLSGDADVEVPIRIRVTRLVRWLAPLVLALILVRGVLQVFSFQEPGEAVTLDMVQAVLVGSAWGHAWLLQLASALVLVVAVQPWERRMLPGYARVNVVLLVLLWAQSGMGHAATDQWPGPLGRVLDVFHLIGIGIWIGTLTTLAIFALPMLRGDGRLSALARVVRSFSLFARAGVLLVVVSGLVAALVYAGSVDLLLASTWGRLLLIKVGLMLGVLVLGWYNWRVVTPALEGDDPRARARLRTAIRLELLLALAMLAVTAVLVASPLPGET